MANTTHRVKKGETAKVLTVTLRHTNADTGKIEPYSIPVGSSVLLYMTLDGADTFKVNAAVMTALDQATKPGKAQYQWLSNNIDIPDVYDLEIVVVLPDTTKLKWPCEEGETFATVIVMDSKTS
jgi:hypothetical protein